MSDSQHLSVRDRISSTEAHDFGDLLYEQLKNAPWVGLSLVVHGLVFVVFLIWPWDTAETGDNARINMAQTEDVEELEEDVPPEVEETKPIEEMEKVIEDPVIKDAKISDHN